MDGAACIFFGHQSVGANILDGIRELTSADPSQSMRIASFPYAPANPCADAVLTHARIGRNGDPQSKTREFVELMTSPAGRLVTIALHKYCYVDVVAATNLADLFRRYRSEMVRLREMRPDLAIVHVTVPLVRESRARPSWLARFLDRSDVRRNNAAREAFNELLRSAYVGREPVFDLACLESMPESVELPSMSAAPERRALLPRYTDDGGHLNVRGRRHVARHLLTLLVPPLKVDFRGGMLSDCSKQT